MLLALREFIVLMAQTLFYVYAYSQCLEHITFAQFEMEAGWIDKVMFCYVDIEFCLYRIWIGGSIFSNLTLDSWKILDQVHVEAR